MARVEGVCDIPGRNVRLNNMDKKQTIEFVKQRRDIISCSEDEPGRSIQITVKPGKYIVTETLTPDGDIRIWEVDF